MARAETVTKLSLDRWSQLMGLNALHFNGIFWPQHPPTVCQQPWMQRADQAVDRVGREEVAYAIAQAEADIERFLGYRLLPAWEVDEWRPTAQPYRPELFNLSATDLRGFSQAIKADWGHMVSGGVRAKSLIQTGRPIVYSDFDGDSYKEVATVTVTVASGQAPCEVHVYMLAADITTGQVADDRYEIKPLTVSVVGVTATITFRREQCLKPSIYDDLVPAASDSHLRGADGSDDANFLAAVDVYRVYNDPQTQVTLMWEPTNLGCACNGSGCNLCAYAVQTGCLMIRGDPRQGMVSFQPGSWNQTTLAFDAEALTQPRSPDIARLYYYAGLRNKNRDCPTLQMDGEWERMVAYMAAANLERPVCECSNVRDFITKWQTDFTTSGETNIRRFPEDMLENPFGTKAGSLYVWQRVNREQQALGRAVLA